MSAGSESGELRLLERDQKRRKLCTVRYGWLLESGTLLPVLAIVASHGR